MNPDFIIIRGRTISTVNAETSSGRHWLRAVMAVDPRNPACVTVQSEFVDEIEKKITEEGFVVTVR